MTAERTVSVDLGDRGYRIDIGAGLLAAAGARIKNVAPGEHVSVITDTHVAALYLAPLRASLEKAGLNLRTVITVEAGEQAKSFASYQRVCERLLADRAERKDTLIALGGGVVGDLTGFVAATLLRGVDFVQIPTTLLAQVDSSVGGKTGINTASGKNLVGAFHQPRLVLADMDTLATLDRREWLAGYAEVIKYGLIDDAEFFARLEQYHADLLAGDAGLIADIVAQCCTAKARIVAEDEREAGKRALLNLGHTFGHGLEAIAGYDGSLLHGEAVALGMVMALDCHARLEGNHFTDRDRLIAHLDAVGLPARPGQVTLNAGRAFTADAVLAAMAGDKKVEAGKLVLILGPIGGAEVRRDVPTETVATTLDAALADYRE